MDHIFSYLKLLLVASLATLAPIKEVFITAGVLVFADMLTGMWAASKRGEKISSAAMRRSVSKFFIYQVAILTGFLTEVYMLDGSVPVSKIVAGLIGAVEAKSILENADGVLGGSLFKSLIGVLGSKNDQKKPPAGPGE